MAMSFSQERAALIRQVAVRAEAYLPLLAAWWLFSCKIRRWCLSFEALDCTISLQPRSWPYYINIREEWQWKLWLRMLYLGPSKRTALCVAWSVFSTLPGEWMAAVSSQVQATAGPLQPISATMLPSGCVPAPVSKPSLFFMSQLQERATVTNTLLCRILMCANQLNSGPATRRRYCSFPQQMPACAFGCNSQRFLKEQIGTVRRHFQRNGKERNPVQFHDTSHRPANMGVWAVCTFTNVLANQTESPVQAWRTSAVRLHPRVCWPLGACGSCGRRVGCGHDLPLPGFRSRLWLGGFRGYFLGAFRPWFEMAAT